MSPNLYRSKINQLKTWKQSKDRKPLIVLGARQVGKTWLVREFGKTEFKHRVYVNFERDIHLQNLFSLNLDPKHIIRTLELYFKTKIEAENTLIFFDEIQSAPQGLTALKYFCEEASEYYLIASDSLLGMSLHNKTSFPVGKVHFLYLYPLTFYEFLLALDKTDLAGILDDKEWTLLPLFAEQFKEYLRYYYYIGGMPEVVSNFAANRDWQQVRNRQLDILTTYENDFGKYAPSELTPRLRMVWQNIPAQLSKENKKFIYGAMKEGARAKDFELAIQWLIDSGILLKNYRVSSPNMPLIAYQDMSAFKLFFNDVGLLAAKSLLDHRSIVLGNAVFTEFKGALTEQFVMQQLKARDTEYIGYWTNERSTSEVDFLIQHKGDVIPIEVKANENLRAKSFRFFCDKYKPKTAIRSSLSNFRQEDWMTNVPLYILADYF